MISHSTFNKFFQLSNSYRQQFSYSFLPSVKSSISISKRRREWIRLKLKENRLQLRYHFPSNPLLYYYSTQSDSKPSPRPTSNNEDISDDEIEVEDFSSPKDSEDTNTYNNYSYYDSPYYHSSSYFHPESKVHTLGDVIGMTNINWFPGHMHKTLLSLKERVKTCKIVLEVRDARVPFSSANPLLEDLIHHKKRIIIFNKSDLATNKSRSLVEEYYKSINIPVIYTKGNTPKNVQRILPIIERLVTRKFSTIPVNLLVVGHPNTGKSSIIASLRTLAQRKRGAPKIASIPGVTRHITGFLVQKDPPVFVYDSPGVMVHNFNEGTSIKKKNNTLKSRIIGVDDKEDEISNSNGDIKTHYESGLKLCLINAIPEKIIGIEILSRYILFKLNQSDAPVYLQPTHICRTIFNPPFEERIEDIYTFLSHILPPTESNIPNRSKDDASKVNNNCDISDDLNEGSESSRRIPLLGEKLLRESRERSMRYLIENYRSGTFGRISLDNVTDTIKQKREEDQFKQEILQEKESINRERKNRIEREGKESFHRTIVDV